MQIQLDKKNKMLLLFFQKHTNTYFNKYNYPLYIMLMDLTDILLAFRIGINILLDGDVFIEGVTFNIHGWSESSMKYRFFNTVLNDQIKNYKLQTVKQNDNH